MKEKIIARATDLFLKLGFKSVTMDDIAGEMCISKKTIYKVFYFTISKAMGPNKVCIFKKKRFIRSWDSQQKMLADLNLYMYSTYRTLGQHSPVHSNTQIS